MWYFDTSRPNHFVSKGFASGLQACLGLAHASKKFKNEKRNKQMLLPSTVHLYHLSAYSH